MKLLLETCDTATVHLHGVLLQACGTSLETTPSTSGLLVQVWFHDNDTLDDASYAGRAVMKSSLWPSKSKKRPRPFSQSARDMQCDVLFVFHRSAAPSLAPQKSNAMPGGPSTASTTTTLESLAYRRLFREVVFRAQVSYSSDKSFRTKAVRGVIVQNEHTLQKTLNNIASITIDTTDTTLHQIPRTEKGSKINLDPNQPVPQKKSSSAKVLARSTPLYLNQSNSSTTSTTSSSTSTSSSSSSFTAAATPSNVLIPPSIEREHVHAVYDTIADHWDGTRYAPWPRVVEFIRSLEFGSLIADVGCGNGKYMQPTYIGRPVAVGRGMIGCDMSKNLIQICGQRNFNALVCDGLLLPYRSNSYDAAISIAVFHHISTEARRLRALSELARIVKVGGSILIYAWAQEQDDDSRRRFETQDVLVPWHLKKDKKATGGTGGKEDEEERSSKRPRVEKDRDGGTTKTAATTAAATTKQGTDATPHKIYQRYCHVYREGDLEKLVNACEHLEVVRTYFDCSNWAIVCKKI